MFSKLSLIFFRFYEKLSGQFSPVVNGFQLSTLSLSFSTSQGYKGLIVSKISSNGLLMPLPKGSVLGLGSQLVLGQSNPKEALVVLVTTLRIAIGCSAG